MESDGERGERRGEKEEGRREKRREERFALRRFLNHIFSKHPSVT